MCMNSEKIEKKGKDKKKEKEISRKSVELHFV